MTHQLSLFSKGDSEAKFQRQKLLLQECIKGGVHLSEGLAALGWAYDDLVYENNYRPLVRGARYFSLDDFRRSPNDIPVVSFFSGAGGLDLGFEAAGFSHAALVEKNALFCETLRANWPDVPVLGPPDFSGDVSARLAVIDRLEKIIGPGEFEGVFVGGPPCQPFSIAANQRFNKSGENFKRVGFTHTLNGNLLFDYIDLIKHFRPAAFLIENVPGLLDIDGGEQLQRAYRELAAVGYAVHEPTILIAAKHFVPQNRTRLFIVGNRLGAKFSPPNPAAEQLNCAAVFKLSLKKALNHETRAHSANSVMRYSQLDYGCRDQLGRVDRLDPRLPSKTVIAGGTAGGGRSHLHPYIPRTLSVRESARLQTFPDNFGFIGPAARQFTQVGNAVPPVLGAQLGQAIFESIFGGKRLKNIRVA